MGHDATPWSQVIALPFFSPQRMSPVAMLLASESPTTRMRTGSGGGVVVELAAGTVVLGAGAVAGVLPPCIAAGVEAVVGVATGAAAGEMVVGAALTAGSPVPALES